MRRSWRKRRRRRARPWRRRPRWRSSLPSLGLRRSRSLSARVRSVWSMVHGVFSGLGRPSDRRGVGCVRPTADCRSIRASLPPFDASAWSEPAASPSRASPPQQKAGSRRSPRSIMMVTRAPLSISTPVNFRSPSDSMRSSAISTVALNARQGDLHHDAPPIKSWLDSFCIAHAASAMQTHAGAPDGETA